MFGLTPFSDAAFASLDPNRFGVLTGVASTTAVGNLANGGISIPLTGVSSATSAGTLLVNISEQDTNTVATGNIGAVVAGPQLPTTGVASTTAVGTMANGARTIALSGVQATGGLGSMLAALSGVIGTGQVGTLAAGPQKAITGVSSTTAVGSLNAGVSPAIIGNTATGSAGSFGVFYWGYIDTSSTAGWSVIDLHNS